MAYCLSEGAAGETVREIAADLGVSPCQVSDALHWLEPMTPGERAVARCLAEGMTYAEVCAELNRKPRSVQTTGSLLRAKGWPVPLAPHERISHPRVQRPGPAALIAPTTIKAREMLAAGVKRAKIRRTLGLSRSALSGIVHRMKPPKPEGSPDA